MRGRHGTRAEGEQVRAEEKGEGRWEAWEEERRGKEDQERKEGGEEEGVKAES